MLTVAILAQVQHAGADGSTQSCRSIRSIYSKQQKGLYGVIHASNAATRVSKPVLFAVMSTMVAFIPMYFIGSMLGVVSAVIRKGAFVILLCSWFSIMNGIAIWRLFL